MMMLNSTAAGRNQKDSELQKGWKVDQLPLNSLQDEEKPVYFSIFKTILLSGSYLQKDTPSHFFSLHPGRTELQLWRL